MAAVTQNTPPRYNVSGSFREQFYDITINESGDTLDVGLNEVVSVQATIDTSITGITWAPIGSGRTGTRITFTGNGFPATVAVTVIGH